MSVRLSDISWKDAEALLNDYSTVILAIGAGSKEHGPHLPLGNDFILAEKLLELVLKHTKLLALPTLNYGHYPAFVEYPISINLRASTFRDIIVDIARSLANYDISNFYILNTGVSTTPPIREAVAIAAEQINIQYLDLLEFDKHLPADLELQEGGTHADELETSMMLYLSPEIVKTDLAVKEYDSRPGRSGLTRNPNGTGHVSLSGVYGDPTLASREKGKIVVDLLVNYIVDQIKSMEQISKR